ncbi:Epidermis-specific secreted glycoprotein EP1 [Melia azedarach]|uniref:Epidermis-specific secreted glycoprotein EP1 n=1 Tax=Melia azedarach TaxID=155640 RepID=A0ACC1XX20_MELAZ|nr:Epidermis-specific secreted glycoprotein EP1 [Melia azedarach]
MASSSAFFIFFFFLALSFSIGRAQVPVSETFKFVNEGLSWGGFDEYDSYVRALDILNPPFQLAFYNTTPNAHTLALLVGNTVQRMPDSYWVWEANRGKPVGEKATFSLGTDGNLVLAEANGTVVWQTNTANKGVVGFKLLPNGNMVLHDSKGQFVWQSFDYPTDTLLVGQSLVVGGRNKLVSRASAKENVYGSYSFVLEYPGFALYYKSKNSPHAARYFTSAKYYSFSVTPNNATFVSVKAFLGYGLFLSMPGGFDYTFTMLNYNSTYSFIRLGMDGNLRIYTLYTEDDKWGEPQVTFTVLDRESFWADECTLPEKCGTFGLCEDNQCVACPTEKGLLGWSKDCAPKKITSCSQKHDVHYYKVEGVEHFLSRYTKGKSPIRAEDCEKKCTKDCKCMGYFYFEEESKCWIVYDLNTLTKSPNSTHVGYIKVPKE